MKATELLVNQHHEVEQLFEQLENVEEGDEKIVREELARNLIGHMSIEEEMFTAADGLGGGSRRGGRLAAAARIALCPALVRYCSIGPPSRHEVRIMPIGW